MCVCLLPYRTAPHLTSLCACLLLPTPHRASSCLYVLFATATAGGCLFTWGGDFIWVDPSDVAAEQAATAREAATTAAAVARELAATATAATALEAAAATAGGDAGDAGGPMTPSSPPSSTSATATTATATTASDRSRAPPPASPLRRKEHHAGCLGTGDREGRLLPTRVRGKLEGKEVAQVSVLPATACLLLPACYCLPTFLPATACLPACYCLPATAC